MSLTQQENNKIKERDEQHTQELRVWRAELAKTKQVSWAVVYSRLHVAVCGVQHTFFACSFRGQHVCSTCICTRIIMCKGLG